MVCGNTFREPYATLVLAKPDRDHLCQSPSGRLCHSNGRCSSPTGKPDRDHLEFKEQLLHVQHTEYIDHGAFCSSPSVGRHQCPAPVGFRPGPSGRLLPPFPSLCWCQIPRLFCLGWQRHHINNFALPTWFLSGANSTQHTSRRRTPFQHYR